VNVVGVLKKPTFMDIFVCAVIALVVGVFVAPIFASGHPAPYRTAALSSVKQSSLGVIIYSSDYDDLFPYVTTPPQMVDLTFPYTKNRDVWNTSNEGKPGIFVYNPSLPGANLVKVTSPELVPMLLDNYGRKGRDQQDYWFFITSFVDGHAKAVRESNWSPCREMLSLKLKRYGKPLNTAR